MIFIGFNGIMRKSNRRSGVGVIETWDVLKYNWSCWMEYGTDCLIETWDVLKFTRIYNEAKSITV